MKPPLYLLALLAINLSAAETPPALYAALAPTNSSWTIRIKEKEDREDKPAADGPATQGGPMTAPNASVLSLIQIDKAGTTRRIIRKWSGGKKEETWWVGHLCFAEFESSEGTKEIRVIDEGKKEVAVIDTTPVNGAILDTGRASALLASGGDYVKGDFPELSWIKPDMRANNETKSETEFRIYRMTANTAPTGQRVDPTFPKSLKTMTDDPDDKNAPSSATQPPKSIVTTAKEAWINASTKLPYKLIEGGSIWTYSFASEPPSLQLPPAFAQALKDYKRAVEAANHRRLP
jgi:hypothetical protein